MEAIIEETLKRFASHYVAASVERYQDLADQSALEFLEAAVDASCLEFWLAKYESLKKTPEVREMADDFNNELSPPECIWGKGL